MKNKIKQSQPNNHHLLPEDTRCCATIASGEQCSRRRQARESSMYCGTHAKHDPQIEKDMELALDSLKHLEMEDDETRTDDAIHGDDDDNDNDMLEMEQTERETYTMDVWTQDIQGIVYFIDKAGNIYHTEDVMNNKIHPRIYATYQVTMNAKDKKEYTLQTFL